MLVDTHTHLNFQEFEKDLDQVIKRAIKNKVEKIVCVSSNLQESEKAIEIAQKYPGIVFAAIGIHPHQTDPKTKLSTKEQLQKLAKLTKRKEVVVIGECGLDYSPAPPGEKDRSQKEQLFLFKKQIELALKEKLPINIHSRKASSETLEILERYGKKGLKGIWHCYSAGKKRIKRISQLGFFFGVDGNLTYDPGFQNVFSQIPLEEIVLETDCPFLTPEPYRGQRSEPSHVKITAEYLAKLKDTTLEEVAKITTQNVKKIFKI
ncbi:MAG TPA: TatD family hydrolase [Patescibacteria group bacterium]|nr:TatD family hydrolase [Patescibacteria group bacterium]